MSFPGFTAETSLYATSASYAILATNYGRSTGGVITGTGWAPVFGRDSAWLEHPGGWPFFRRCGALGEDCCRAPIQNPDSGPYVSCQDGLGCDITTGKCVSPCGGTGKVCCDGPGTRATKWTPDGKVYSPNTWNMREMCDQGACDRQSHRCFACGTQDGAPCCPPDAAQATARCIGTHVECEFDPVGFFVSGTCRGCGIKGKPPCRWGCDPGLDIRNGLCDICGGDSQSPCDRGCNRGLGLAHGLCAECGGQGQPPCDSGCNSGTILINGVCTACGDEGQPPCAGMTCHGDLHPNIDILSNRLLCTVFCGHFHQYACRTTYAVPDGVRSRYRCFNHSKLFAAGPADPSNCLCVPSTSNDQEDDVSDNSGFCISAGSASGDIPDPPDCDGPDCTSKHEE
jgi:hypothetical protein